MVVGECLRCAVDVFEKVDFDRRPISADLDSNDMLAAILKSKSAKRFCDLKTT